MKKLFASVALVACASSSAMHARQQTPTFRSGVSLVTIDVTVLDKDGKPVPGLTADDIEIKLSGKPQPIRALAFVQASAPGPATPPAPKPATPATTAASQPAAAPAVTVPPPPPLPAVNAALPRRTFSNDGAPKGVKPPPPTMTAPAAAPPPPAPVAAPEPAPAAGAPTESRVFVLLVDDLSFSPQRGKAMFTAASRFLDRIPANDLVGFTTTTGVGSVNPVRDRAAVRVALAKVVGAFNDPRGVGKSGPGDPGCGTTPDSPLGINEAIDIDRGNDALLGDVIVRECFNGDRTQVMSKSVPQIVAECTCAQDVSSQARRVAALARQNKGRQFDGIKNVINAMKVASGIRHLVLLTEGLPVSREVDELNPLVRAAAQAGIQLSVLLEEPDFNIADEGRRSLPPNSNPQPDPGFAKRRQEDDKLLVNGAQTLNDMLGGMFYKVVGNADPFFDRVIVASSAVYRLGVELPSGTQPGKEFNVTVSVKKPGLTARANKFAIAAVADAVPAAAPAPAPAAPSAPAKPAAPTAPEAPKTVTESVPGSIDDVLKAVLNANTSVGDVPMRAAVTVRRSNSVAGQVDVSLNLAIPAAVKGPLTAFVGVVDANGGIKVNRRILEPVAGADYTVPYLLPVTPGDYRLRVAVADAGGGLGSIEVPVRATLAQFGEFTSSDILTWVVDSADRAQLFTLDEVPATQTLHATIELYPAAQMPGEFPIVEWSLMKEGDSRPLVDADSPARPAATLLRSDAEFPWDKLGPGTYLIRADLIVNDKIAGTRSVTVRKR